MIMDGVKLFEVYKSYDLASREADNFKELADDAMDEIKGGVWNLCLMLQSPLSPKISEVLAKCAKYNQEEKTATVHDQGQRELKCPPVFRTEDIPIEVPNLSNCLNHQLIQRPVQ